MLETARAVEIGTDDRGNENFHQDDNAQAMRPRPLNHQCNWRVIKKPPSTSDENLGVS